MKNRKVKRVRGWAVKLAHIVLKYRMVRQCSWCNRYLDLFSALMQYYFPGMAAKHMRHSHGICPACYLRMQAENSWLSGAEAKHVSTPINGHNIRLTNSRRAWYASDEGLNKTTDVILKQIKRDLSNG